MLISLLAVATFITGINAIQKGEVAWSRTKTITGQTAKVIGYVLIVVSIALAALTLGFSFMSQQANSNFGMNNSTSSSTQ